MKAALLSLFLTMGILESKAQCIFIYANEKVKGVEIPIANEEFQIIINDSINHKRRTKSDGSLGRISLERGTYRVKIVHPEFSEGFKSEVIVGDRTTDVEILLTRSAAARREEKR